MRRAGIGLAVLAGDDQPDPELASFSTLPTEACHRLWQYLVHGGIGNAVEFLRYAASLTGYGGAWLEPRPLLRAGLYWLGREQATLADIRSVWSEPARPVAAVVFYRALVQSGNLKAIDALIAALTAEGLNPLPVFASSLKDAVAAATIERLFTETQPAIVLNGTGFAVSAPSTAATASVFPGCDGVVLQVIFSGSDEAQWRDGSQGLSARDIAMNVALPEVDGRVISRAVSFKGAARHDRATETTIVNYEPVADRIAFVARLAAAWVALKTTPAAERRIALVLANYPNRDGRLGNGVGLDTPASAVVILNALREAGYAVADVPADGNALVERLSAGPTNDWRRLGERTIRETLPLGEYRAFFAGLPSDVQARVSERWGAPEDDPFFVAGMPAGGGQLRAGRCPLRVGRAGPAAGARLQHRSAGELPRSRPGAAAQLLRVLRLDPPPVRGARGGPPRQARQSRMAAGQGGRAVGTLLPGSRAGAAAEPLPLHRQRSR